MRDAANVKLEERPFKIARSVLNDRPRSVHETNVIHTRKHRRAGVTRGIESDRCRGVRESVAEARAGREGVFRDQRDDVVITVIAVVIQPDRHPVTRGVVKDRSHISDCAFQ
jgi:hypothetical protein